MRVHPYDIEFIQDAGQSNNGRYFDLLMIEYPTIPAAKKGYTSYQIPGRAGELLQDNKTKENITIKVPLVLVVDEDEQLEYRDRIRKITRWLTGSGWLRFSDDQPFWYRVLSCQFNESDRETPIYGKVGASFIVEPYEYMNNGRIWHEADDIRYNGYDLCMPKYRVTGEKNGTVTINDYAVTINVGQNIIIDTKAQLTFRESNGEIINAAITGDYENMYLPNGEVVITASEGLNVEVMPLWGYEL